jgi:type VI secretion system protein ImpL
VTWGLVLVAIVLATTALVLVWFNGDMFNLSTVDAKKSASIWILASLAAVLILHLTAMGVGAYNVAGRLFRRETGSPAIAESPALKNDARLHHLSDDLRALHGWRWRYRLPWLLLSGNESLIETVAPGLKQAGVLHVGETILVHAAPDGIDATSWRKQLRQLRRQRPVDRIVQIVRAREDDAAAAELPRLLAGIATDLGWAAPLTFLHVVETDGRQPEVFQPVGAFLSGVPRGAAQGSSIELKERLTTLEYRTASTGIRLCAEPAHMPYLGQLSAYIGEQRERIVATWETLAASKWLRAPLDGVMFAPVFAANHPRAEPAPAVGAAAGAATTEAKPATPVAVARVQPISLLSTWQEIGHSLRGHRGEHMGFYWPKALSTTLVVGAIGWCMTMAISFVGNLHLIRSARASADAAFLSASGTPAALRTSLALQQQIQTLEYRQLHGAPWYQRAGLNHDPDLLTALWPPYTKASHTLLTTPIRQNLEAALVDLSQMQTEQLDDQTNRLALDGHKALKTYLMLAEPARADAGFLTQQLTHYWSTNAHLPTGEKLDLSERLLDFYAQHLKAHEDWRIRPRQELVNASRQTLLAVIGVKNSEDTIYQSVLETAGNRYPDQTLASLTAGTDTRGLLRTSSAVAGVFTRQAYEGTIAASIDDAAKRNEAASDWVLATDAQRQAPQQSADDMKASLTSRYFADYADHWQGFMNTLQWESSPTLPSAIQQLKLMADARQSPVIALMKTLEFQGGAGALKTSLSDTLVEKAQHVLGGKIEGPEMARPDPAGPLGASFGPVLRLVAPGNANRGASGDLSLQRFMDRVTTLRLKLQQISDSPDDAQAKQVAQSLFQGKGSELADTQAYAQLIAASLGAQWAGMGDALFVRPVAQATQSVLQPAQASLNDAWRETVVATWNRSFAGRYPFANTDNDASLPELARFLRPQGGLIGAFLGSQLAGVLELQGDQWVPAAAGNTTLTFDPAFLKALNTLQRIAGHLLAQGEPQYRFDFKPVPAAGVTDTVLTLDGQSLHYYNQQETWQALTWPSNDPQRLGTRLQWQTEKAGTNKSFEFGGRWGLIRMLERARVQPIDSGTFQLTWQAAAEAGAAKAAQTAMPVPAASGASATIADNEDEYESGTTPLGARRLDSLTTQAPLTAASQALTYPLSFVMRTDVGKGPLELLALRNFALPTRIFAGKGPVAATGARKIAQADGPPPLPQAMLDAAKHAETPLPGGMRPL